MTIQIDSREKARAIKNIIAYFDEMHIKHYTSKLFVGDYMSLDNPRLIIDRKQNLLELCGNVGQEHARFVGVLIRARDNGIKLIITFDNIEQLSYSEQKYLDFDNLTMEYLSLKNYTDINVNIPTLSFNVVFDANALKSILRTEYTKSSFTDDLNPQSSKKFYLNKR